MDTGDVFVDQSRQGRDLEPPGLRESSSSQPCSTLLLQIRLQPVRDGDAETDLGPVEKAGREVMTHSIAEDEFASPPGDLHPGRYAQAEIDKLVVKQWGSGLKRVSHGHTVGLDEKLLGKVRQHVGALHARESFPLSTSVRVHEI